MTNVQRSRRQVRLSRALGIALTPKAQRIFEKRPYAPGEHGRDRRRTESDYAVRMREKQRLRAQYGISEKQLRAAYEKATRTAGQTGNAMLTDLETRLDNLVLRAGFARTTAQARQRGCGGGPRTDGLGRWCGRSLHAEPERQDGSRGRSAWRYRSGRRCGCPSRKRREAASRRCHTEREDAAFRADALRNRTQCDGGCDRARPEHTDAFRKCAEP